MLRKLLLSTKKDNSNNSQTITPNTTFSFYNEVYMEPVNIFIISKGLKFPRSESGKFKQPADNLYSRHYRPIVKEKVKYNEDWELRASLFGKVEMDYKKDRIIDKYVLQTNTFKTPRSNALISTMSRSQMY